MKTMLRVGLLAACVALPAVAQAQTMYKCKDASGRTLSSDRPIPECDNRAVQVLGKDGLVRREIAAPLTPEQKRAQQAAAEKQKQDAREADEQTRVDKAIATRYRSEADITLAHSRATEPVQDQIKRDVMALKTAEERLKKITDDAAARPKDAPQTAVEKRRVEDAQASVKARQKSLADQQQELVQINAKFDQTMKRYRELSGTK